MQRGTLTADPAPLFETIKVTKAFGAFKALNNVSFRVSDGEFVSIVGPNGAGKTTLVNVVTGLLRPTVGEVRFMGRISPASGRSNWRGAACRAPFSSSISFRR